MVGEEGAVEEPDRVEIDWDLLEPTLTERDDAAGFQKPWNPWSVLVVAAICKPVIGTIILAMNARRLGLPRQVFPLALSGTLVSFVVMALVPLYVTEEMSEDLILERGRVVRFSLSFLGAGICLAMNKNHQRRLRVYQMGDGEPGSLILPGAILIIVSLFVLNPLLYGWMEVITKAVFWGGG